MGLFNEEAQKYLKLLREDEVYDGYYLGDNLEILKAKCTISNDGSYNYHNNYDDSQPTLYIILDERGTKIERWWTLSENEIKEKQSYVIEGRIKDLKKQINFLESIKGIIH